jgi:hypothetical protein
MCNSISTSNLFFCLMRKWNARQYAAPEGEAFRRQGGIQFSAAADKSDEVRVTSQADDMDVWKSAFFLWIKAFRTAPAVLVWFLRTQH